jgi:hypothetical protein
MNLFFIKNEVIPLNDIIDINATINNFSSANVTNLNDTNKETFKQINNTFSNYTYKNIEEKAADHTIDETLIKNEFLAEIKNNNITGIVNNETIVIPNYTESNKSSLFNETSSIEELNNNSSQSLSETLNTNVIKFDLICNLIEKQFTR